MASRKRPRTSDVTEQRDYRSPFIPMFEHFRSELDEHHDRRERIAKASRDITAQSKKMIFTLQRTPHLHSDLRENLKTDLEERRKAIHDSFESISSDLAGSLRTWRYERQITGGLQEYIEALTFGYYLYHQRLMTQEEIQTELPNNIHVDASDYLLGLYDMTGEMMRYAITAMATRGVVPGDEEEAVEEEDDNVTSEPGMDSDPRVEATKTPQPKRTILTDMRTLRTHLEWLSFELSRSVLKSETEKKAQIMKESVEKVERSVYGLIVRGSERPKGWIPDLRETDGHGPEPVETF